MAVVLNSEETIHFSASHLHRSHSQQKFVTSPSYSNSPPRSTSSVGFQQLISPASSVLSSGLSSPRTVNAGSPARSYKSTSSSSISLDTRCETNDEDQLVFPSYDDVGYYQQEDLEPPTSPRTGDSYTVSPNSDSTSANVSRLQSPEPVEHAEDDTAIRIQPSRHVDYLSHNWKEEDIWSSWKHIVSKRKAYNNSARLENASWRTWMKSKNKLKTVSPETLNWLKDCDVTWLYGPLQTRSERSFLMPTNSPSNSSRLSKSNSFLAKKPILKKRSVSEIMLQRSLSSSSLLKQAAAAVQAQQSETTGRVTSDYVYPFPSRRPSTLHPSYLSSISSSNLTSPGNADRKHIHFNEQVEQCIALEMKGDEEEEFYSIHDHDDSDSDDGGIIMKRSSSKRTLPPLQCRRKQHQALGQESKTIAMLPSTKLKYRPDTPELPGSTGTVMKLSNGIWVGTKLSPSPSQETLRPSKPSTSILLGKDDEDEDMDWQPGATMPNRKDSISVTQERFQNIKSSGSSSSATDEPTGMRRTPSGMFMPYDEEEDTAVSEGLFGKVVDTVNTAKDIAHVIWNVGWRR